MENLSRRAFMGSAALATVAPAFAQRAAAVGKEHKIRDIQTMTIQGPQRTFVFVKVVADDGVFGMAEAYGTPAIGVKEQVLGMKRFLVGRDPLQIDVIYTFLDEHGRDLSGTRTDGSAHNLMRAASAIDMALWDLAGKILGVAASTLLGGRFRKRVRVYDHAAPRNMLDKASCREWAAKVREDPAGFTAHKIGFPYTKPDADLALDPSNRVLTTKELIQIAQAMENCREAIGWDHDLMVHNHWEWDLRTSIELAQAVESIKPLWLEDPLPVDYSEAWPKLCEASKVPILTGENLERREGFKDFIIHHGCDILHPDLRNSGGFLETKRIADMASIFAIPMANHNSGSQIHTWNTCQWASSIRDYLCCETFTGLGDWADTLMLLDGPYIKNGFIEATEKPGLGVELNPDVIKAHLAPGEVWWG